MVLAAPALLLAMVLSQETLQGWNEQVQRTDAEMQQRLAAGARFMWIDESPDRRDRLRQGEILVEPAQEKSPLSVPHGLVHDWIGAVFIPNTTIKAVFSVLNSFERYPDFYRPTVVSAKLLEDSGNKQRFSMVLLEKAPFVTAAVESEYISQKTCIDARHCYSVIYSTRIQQIEDYGEPSQHTLPPDRGDGFVWRLYSIERFEERDGGVYAEFEALGLSRDIPFAIRWLVRPIVRHLPRDSMIGTLQKTRDAVRANKISSDELLTLKPKGAPIGGGHVRPPAPTVKRAPPTKQASNSGK